MAENPWLTIIGLGEDGPKGLPPASLTALEAAEIVLAPARHMSLLSENAEQKRLTWPVPFADGIEKLLSMRGQRVAVLASGDPFWFGAGSVLTRQLQPDEWQTFPAVSCFSLAASALGWPLEETICLGLHASPFSRLRPHLAQGSRLIVTLRDANAPVELANYLIHEGFEDSQLHVMQALGGPRERIESCKASDIPKTASFVHPLCVAIQVSGTSRALPKASGRGDEWFDHDGQITKRPIRALTLSALAPRTGEHLWDIGGGAGSIAIEWLLADQTLTATTIEVDPTRADRIKNNAARLGQDRLRVVTGKAPDALKGLDRPNAVFAGGGLTNELLAVLTQLDSGTRIVANAVTLEGEALLTSAQDRFGGDLMRIELSHASPLGKKRGWRTAYPIVQWSVAL